MAVQKFIILDVKKDSEYTKFTDQARKVLIIFCYEVSS